MAESTPAGRGEATLVAIYLLAATLLCAYLLVRVWPHPTPSFTAGAPGATGKTDQKNDATPPPAKAAGVAAASGSVGATGATGPTGATGATDATGATAATGATGASGRDAAGAKGTTGATGGTGATGCSDCESRVLAERAKWESAGGQWKFDPQCISIFGHEYLLWNEQRLLLLILLAGAIGSLAHGLRSFYGYVGNRELKQSWLLMYLLLPFSGSLIALILYVVARGGLFNSQSSTEATSPFGFAAVAVVAGMFSRQAVEKLKHIAEGIFTTVQPEKDPLTGAPKLTKLDPTEVKMGSEASLTLTGSSFSNSSKVQVDGTDVATKFVSATQLGATVPAALLKAVGQVSKVIVINPGPSGGKSDELTLKVV